MRSKEDIEKRLKIVRQFNENNLPPFKTETMMNERIKSCREEATLEWVLGGADFWAIPFDKIK